MCPPACIKVVANTEGYYSIKNVKAVIPADRLCLLQLEDGMDWDKICPFLDLPVPDEEYPSRNDPEEFQRLVKYHVQPYVNAAMMRLAAVSVPVVGVLGWACLKYGPSVVAAVRRAS